MSRSTSGFFHTGGHFTIVIMSFSYMGHFHRFPSKKHNREHTQQENKQLWTTEKVSLSAICQQKPRPSKVFIYEYWMSLGHNCHNYYPETDNTQKNECFSFTFQFRITISTPHFRCEVC